MNDRTFTAVSAAYQEIRKQLKVILKAGVNHEIILKMVESLDEIKDELRRQRT